MILSTTAGCQNGLKCYCKTSRCPRLTRECYQAHKRTECPPPSPPVESLLYRDVCWTFTEPNLSHLFVIVLVISVWNMTHIPSSLSIFHRQMDTNGARLTQLPVFAQVLRLRRCISKHKVWQKEVNLKCLLWQSINNASLNVHRFRTHVQRAAPLISHSQTSLCGHLLFIKKNNNF